MNNIIHFVNTGFSRGINCDLDWWEYRLKIFKFFTLQSLINQTNKDFYLLLFLRTNYPLVSQLEEVIKSSGLKYLIVYEDIKNNFENALNSLPDFKNAEYVYDTRIDSDDLFHKDVISEIKNYNFKWRRALVFQKGYCYDCINKRLQHYRMPSPPFSTLLYPKNIYAEEDKRVEYVGELHGHDQIFSNFNSVVLSENKYIVLVHKENNRTTYIENFIEFERFEIPEIEHNSILNDFSINTQTYNQV